jgi:hypothetical protein
MPRVPENTADPGEGEESISRSVRPCRITSPPFARPWAKTSSTEEKLGYVHKGIEKRFESLSWQEAARLAARVSGDTTVAHSLAYAQAVEALTGAIVPDRAMWLRALFLERERIANHLGDLGAICNDVAFAILLYQFHRLKEYLLRTNQSSAICDGPDRAGRRNH